MKIETGEKDLDMTHYNMKIIPDYSWICRCGRRNGNEIQQCESCGRKRPPQISLGGKIR